MGRMSPGGDDRDVRGMQGLLGEEVSGQSSGCGQVAGSVAGVDRRARLEQEHRRLCFGAWLVGFALRHDVGVSAPRWTSPSSILIVSEPDGTRKNSSVSGWLWRVNSPSTLTTRTS